MKFYNDCFGVAAAVAEPPAYTAIKAEDNGESVGNSGGYGVPPGADWIPMRQLYNAHRL